MDLSLSSMRRQSIGSVRFTFTPSRTKRSVTLGMKNTTSDAIFLLQVECKKAQPKEVVQAANTAALLGKRVILSNLGILPGLAVPGLAPTAATAAQQPTAVQQQHQQQLTAGHNALQAALQQQLAASAALGKKRIF